MALFATGKMPFQKTTTTTITKFLLLQNQHVRNPFMQYRKCLFSSLSNDYLNKNHGEELNHLPSTTFNTSAHHLESNNTTQSVSSTFNTDIPDKLISLNEYDFGICSNIQSFLEIVQSTTGLPWWATIACTSLSLRVLLSPVMIFQAKSIARLVRAKPEMEYLYSLLREALLYVPEKKHTLVKMKKYIYFADGLQLIWSKHNCHPIRAIATPLVQIPCFISFALTVREMIHSKVPGLENGGAFWFTDLTAADPTLVLPLAAIALTYTNLELSMGKSDAYWIKWVKDKLQILTIISTPFVITLPQGIFMYWLVSSGFGLVQIVALRHQGLRKTLGLPPLLAARNNSG